MKANRDPEQNELVHLTRACPITDKVVLEIGCGEGKFTFQYAGTTRRVTGLDIDEGDLEQAYRCKPDANVHFVQGNAEKLPFGSESYDIVIFASSL